MLTFSPYPEVNSICIGEEPAPVSVIGESQFSL